ncbi:Hypothetical predicted protein [Olea europaea subsp. europaea]|uniref:Uncharacterized protein n=1 Tax=Olea europaea subsp. europaea TaxID=158383 RepID=A0A8S0QXQ7_OLEEU|nr:Hypothetical predicted protein [Olea europaea subsp. europaea]
MDMKRRQRTNREFKHRATKVISDAQKLKDEAAAALEASKLKQSKVNALEKRIENSDNLQKIASTALEVANKDKVKSKAKVEELTTEAADLKQWLERTGVVAIDEHIAHFHEIAKYDDLRMYWRGVAYKEVFKRLAELYS